MIYTHFLLFFSRDTGSAETFDTEVHTVAGARLPMQRCELPSTKLSKDEASGDAHEEL